MLSHHQYQLLRVGSFTLGQWVTLIVLLTFDYVAVLIDTNTTGREGVGDRVPDLTREELRPDLTLLEKIKKKHTHTLVRDR